MADVSDASLTVAVMARARIGAADVAARAREAARSANMMTSSRWR